MVLMRFAFVLFRYFPLGGLERDRAQILMIVKRQIELYRRFQNPEPGRFYPLPPVASPMAKACL